MKKDDRTCEIFTEIEQVLFRIPVSSAKPISEVYSVLQFTCTYEHCMFYKFCQISIFIIYILLFISIEFENRHARSWYTSIKGI